MSVKKYSLIPSPTLTEGAESIVWTVDNFHEVASFTGQPIERLMRGDFNTPPILVPGCSNSVRMPHNKNGDCIANVQDTIVKHGGKLFVLCRYHVDTLNKMHTLAGSDWDNAYAIQTLTTSFEDVIAFKGFHEYDSAMAGGSLAVYKEQVTRNGGNVILYTSDGAKVANNLDYIVRFGEGNTNKDFHPVENFKFSKLFYGK